MSDFSGLYTPHGSLTTLVTVLDAFAPIDILDKLVGLIDKKDKNALLLEEMIIGVYRKIYSDKTAIAEDMMKVVGQTLLLAHNIADLHDGLIDLLEDARRDGGTPKERGSAAGAFIAIERIVSSVLAQITTSIDKAAKMQQSNAVPIVVAPIVDAASSTPTSL
jgi:hypothetical protein